MDSLRRFNSSKGVNMEADSQGGWVRYEDAVTFAEANVAQAETRVRKELGLLEKEEDSPEFTFAKLGIQGVKLDSGKPRYSLMPPIALELIVKVLTFGAEKYSPNNWKYVDNAEERYLDATMRHIEAYRRGEFLDAESGLPHLAHAGCCISFLLELTESKTKI